MSATYQPTLTAAVAHERVNDLLREAARSRTAAKLTGRTRHRTPRRRPLWWVRVTARPASLRTA